MAAGAAGAAAAGAFGAAGVVGASWADAPIETITRAATEAPIPHIDFVITAVISHG